MTTRGTNDINKTNIFPRFFTKPVKNEAESAKQGVPVYKEVEYVEIIVAGDNKSTPVHKVRQTHIDRWPDKYETFKAGKKAVHDGTPLIDWPRIGVAKEASLNALGIFSVQALANLPETAIPKLGMGGRQLIEEAKAYLETAAGNAVAATYARKCAYLEDVVKSLTMQLKSIGDAISAADPDGSAFDGVVTTIPDFEFKEDDWKHVPEPEPVVPIRVATQQESSKDSQIADLAKQVEALTKLVVSQTDGVGLIGAAASVGTGELKDGDIPDDAPLKQTAKSSKRSRK